MRSNKWIHANADFYIENVKKFQMILIIEQRYLPKCSYYKLNSMRQVKGKEAARVGARSSNRNQGHALS